MRFLILSALLCSLTPGLAAARDLTVVGFGGGFQDAARVHLFQAWAKATGAKLQDDTYNGEVARIYAMTQARDVTWDVVMVEAPELARGCEDGVFARLDRAVVRQDKFIPGGVTPCGAGAVGWGVALFYDQKRIAAGPRSYAELWDTKTFPGKRSLRFGPKMTLEIALLSDGVAPADVYAALATKAGQDRAFARLDAIKPDIIWVALRGAAVAARGVRRGGVCGGLRRPHRPRRGRRSQLPPALGHHAVLV